LISKFLSDFLDILEGLSRSDPYGFVATIPNSFLLKSTALSGFGIVYSTLKNRVRASRGL
jgi:hypothetical protein